MKGEPVRILLVEDNEDHAEAVKRSFARHQMANEILHVADGETALDLLQGRTSYPDDLTWDRPHLIILDLRLPRVDGLEVLKIIKTTEGLKRLPVVILTSSHAEADVVRAYDYHANSYVVKPLDFDKFVGLMRDLGFYWLAWNVDPYPEGRK